MPNFGDNNFVPEVGHFSGRSLGHEFGSYFGSCVWVIFGIILWVVVSVVLYHSVLFWVILWVMSTCAYQVDHETDRGFNCRSRQGRSQNAA
eukprot:2294004-Amphidinium_carterae.1